MTPINYILIGVFLVIVYLRFRPKPAFPKAPPPVLFRVYTPPTLQKYNGTNGMPVYLSVRGRVFDVTSSANFYGPGGPYSNFSGKDASRGLACGSYDMDMFKASLTGPLDTLEDLGPSEMASLKDWEDRFLEKYPIIGKLVAVGSPEADA
jgi:membrane-associated progesterone receptor component